MKFGILQMTHCSPRSDSAEAYQLFIDRAMEADRLGYWSCWTTEHHFGSDDNYRPMDVSRDVYETIDYDLAPDPLILFSHLAARTKQIRFGTGVVVLHWDHPIRVAERAAMLDVLSGGRLELGVGRGAGFREVGMFNAPTDNDESRRKFEEAVEVIRKAWSGEPLNHDGEFWHFENLLLRPRPTRQPAPLWIASASQESAEYAGRVGLPYATITWPLTPLHLYSEKRAAWLKSAEDAGQAVDDLSVPMVLMMYCGESDAEAQETAYERMIKFQYINEQHYELRLHGINIGDMEYLARFPSENHIIGSPDTCIERLEWFKQETGLNYLVGFIDFGMIPHEKVVASMQRFAEKVIPHFASDEAGVRSW